MKKIISLLLILIFAFALASCASNEESTIYEEQSNEDLSKDVIPADHIKWTTAVDHDNYFFGILVDSDFPGDGDRSYRPYLLADGKWYCIGSFKLSFAKILAMTDFSSNAAKYGPMIKDAYIVVIDADVAKDFKDPSEAEKYMEYATHIGEISHSWPEMLMPDEKTTRQEIKAILETEYSNLYYYGSGVKDSIDFPGVEEEYISEAKERTLALVDKAVYSDSFKSSNINWRVFMRKNVDSENKNSIVNICVFRKENQIAIEWRNNDFDYFGTLIVEDPELYWLIRNKKYDSYVVTQEAQNVLNVIEPYLEIEAQKQIEQLEKSSNYWNIIDHKLVEFALAGTYENVSGFDKIEVYHSYYGYLTDNPDETYGHWGGGMNYTSDCYFVYTNSIEKVCSIIGYQNGEIKALAFDSSEFFYAPFNANKQRAVDLLNRDTHIDI